MVPTDFGKEVAVDVEGKSSTDISTQLQELIKAGESMPRYMPCGGTRGVCDGCTAEHGFHNHHNNDNNRTNAAPPSNRSAESEGNL